MVRTESVGRANELVAAAAVDVMLYTYKVDENTNLNVYVLLEI